jgi:hypothetical protein
MIWWSICGCSKETTPSFICNLFIWISNYLLFVCMNNDFNNLYGSGGGISCRLGSAALFLTASAHRRECLFSNIRAESTIKWATPAFWSGVWGARLGNRRPYTKIGATPNGPKNACAGRCLGGGGGSEWRCFETAAAILMPKSVKIGVQNL